MTLYSLGAVTVAAYRVRTGDATTSGLSVTGALVEAETLLGEELRRDLAFEERTETMLIREGGRCYPRAWPIVTCATNTIDGRALLGGTPDVSQFLATLDSCESTPRATITYSGGFDDGTDSAPLPLTLAHALYDLARALVAEGAPIPLGATSMSVGDVSVTLAAPNAGRLDAYVPGLGARIARYRNRFV